MSAIDDLNQSAAAVAAAVRDLNQAISQTITAVAAAGDVATIGRQKAEDLAKLIGDETIATQAAHDQISAVIADIRAKAAALVSPVAAS